jgi:hypothetical protein
MCVILLPSSSSVLFLFLTVLSRILVFPNSFPLCGASNGPDQSPRFVILFCWHLIEQIVYAIKAREGRGLRSKGLDSRGRHMRGGGRRVSSPLTPENEPLFLRRLTSSKLLLAITTRECIDLTSFPF